MSETQETNFEPFHDDRLDRKKSAKFLTDYLVGRHRAGSVPANKSFVLNVNAEWGLGKTYFLTEWTKMLRERGHPVVYFDAWKNDYSANPFVGFMAEIENQLTAHLGTKENLKRQAKAIFKTGAKVIWAAAPTVALSVVKNLSGLDAEKFAAIVKDSTIDAISEVKRDLEKENKGIRDAINEFKSAFERFTLAVQEDAEVTLPVFLMVDELDRCRPTYAIELLENIKHIFGIANVYTIVATDSQQLAHSIRAIYGARFDSQKYLRRFFDHESRLDSPNYVSLASAIIESRKMDDGKELLNPLKEFYPKAPTAELISLIAKALKVTTRDLHRSIDIIDSVRLTQRGPFDLFLLAFLTMLYVSHQAVFDDYQQVRYGQKIRDRLVGRSDLRITFKERERGSEPYRGQTETAVPVIDWACSYLDKLWSDNPFEGQEQWLGLNYALGPVSNGQISLEYLRNYGSLISMVGHFSM